MANLTFSEKDHEYRVDGVVIPSVTQVIKAAGLADFDMVNQSVMERAIQFGNAVHKAIELDSKGTLDEPSVDEALRPYLAHWKKFCMDYMFFAQRNEYRAFNEILRVGFCIDHFGHIGNDTAIVDVKTGTPKPADVIQICGYGKLIPVSRLILLYLTEDRYRVIEVKGHDRRHGENIFMSCLAVYNFKKEKGIL